MNRILLVAIGGSIGAVARYWLSGWVQGRFGGLFPLGTMLVNLVGCFMLGALMALVQDHPLLRPEWRSFIAIGILGAFTTFSTFAYETGELLHGGQFAHAALNVAGNVVLGLFAVEAGRLLTRALSL